MQTFADKVAVVTGAASGIGRALAAECVRQGMRVALADIEIGQLNAAHHELTAAGGQVIAVKTDVSNRDEVAALADTVWNAYGEVHLLFNNAGVATMTSILDATLQDWEWVMGVNLWGTIYGVNAFVPRMLNQDVDCHVVNTASILGLNSGPGSASYRVTKHAIVALSETLYYDLRRLEARIGVSVLCPGAVNTRIVMAERNRPAHLTSREPKQIPNPARIAKIKQSFAKGMSPDEVATLAFAAIRDNRFYILTNPGNVDEVRQRLTDITEIGNPTPRK